MQSVTWKSLVRNDQSFTMGWGLLNVVKKHTPHNLLAEQNVQHTFTIRKTCVKGMV